MKNLEFKNPIQKFKEGRKIKKCQDGQTIQYIGRDGKKYEAWRGERDWYYHPVGTFSIFRMPHNYVTTGGQRFYESTPEGAVANTFETVNAQNTKRQPSTSYPDGAYFEEKGPDGKIKKGRWQGGKKVYMTDAQLTPARTPAEIPAGNTRTGGRVGSTVRRPKFVSRLGDLNLTAEEKAFLEGRGVNVNDATSMQNFILKNYANADLGAREGAGIADGYFGDKSFRAFQALRNQGIFTPKVDASEPVRTINETPVDAPDFGYATDQDYSDGSQFKRLGFNNYQGLLLYAQNSQDQFAKDLRERFRDKLTDQNYVESQLGISGKYRGGNAGDFGDIARSMQAWKTGINNEFDRRRAAYAQARLAERTGSDGTVYSSPEMMKKFDGINVSPGIKFGRNKLDFSDMKFNVNYGNIGANTLGNIGILGNTGLS